MLRTTALALCFGLAAFTAFSGASTAQDARQREFLIQNDDGYGTSDCLAKASACGKIVADAWCESKGFAKAVAYRPAASDEVTHSVTTSRRQALSEAFVIACAE